MASTAWRPQAPRPSGKATPRIPQDSPAPRATRPLCPTPPRYPGSTRSSAATLTYPTSFPLDPCPPVDDDDDDSDDSDDDQYLSLVATVPSTKHHPLRRRPLQRSVLPLATHPATDQLDRDTQLLQTLHIRLIHAEQQAIPTRYVCSGQSYITKPIQSTHSHTRLPADTLVRATPLLPSSDLFALQSLIVRARDAIDGPLATRYQSLLPLGVSLLARYHWPLAWRVAGQVAAAFGGGDLYDDLMAIVRIVIGGLGRVLYCCWMNSTFMCCSFYWDTQ